MVGDVSHDGAVFWSRADRTSRMWVAWDVGELSSDPHMIRGPIVRPATDLTGRLFVGDLPPDQTIAYAVRFEDTRTGQLGDPVHGSFRTPSLHATDVRFVWSGDLAGQGWGIDTSRGGYRIFDAMRSRDPDFMICSGDRIYADGPLPEERLLPDGTRWKNLMTPAKAHVAETLSDFRGCHRYNHLDAAFRHFHAKVPIIAQWGDHEVVNNWHPGGWVSDDRYTTHDMTLLAKRARQAFGEYVPMRTMPLDWARIYRKIPYGPLLDIFVLDVRSYRGPNGDNLQRYPRPDAAWMGRTQLEWLKRQLAKSTALWKVIACPQPLGTVVWNDHGARKGHDGVANGDGAPAGREQELAHLFLHMQQKNVRNVVWLTGDVHYAAAHHYHPDRASFRSFTPFWEFVAGPMHAGTFGPSPLDDTFGPEVVWQRVPDAEQMGRGPAEGLQFFGEVQIASDTRALTVRLLDIEGSVLHTEVVLPAAGV